MRQAVEKQFASFDKIKLTVRDQVVHVDPTAHVAWFSEVADWDIVTQGHPARIDGSRITGVLEKRNGNWLIVQFHVSVPVPAQVAKY